MYMRAVTFRIVYVGVLGLGILAGTAFRETTVQAAPAAAPAPAARAAVAAVAVPVVTLPTVRVKHSAARSSASLPKPAVLGRVAAAVLPDSAIAPADQDDAAIPTVRLDMPYYSLGKLLPRVGRTGR